MIDELTPLFPSDVPPGDVPPAPTENVYVVEVTADVPDRTPPAPPPPLLYYPPPLPPAPPPATTI